MLTWQMRKLRSREKVTCYLVKCAVGMWTQAVWLQRLHLKDLILLFLRWGATQLPSYCAVGCQPRPAVFLLPFPMALESSVKSLQCQLFPERCLALSRHWKKYLLDKWMMAAISLKQPQGIVFNPNPEFDSLCKGEKTVTVFAMS